MASRPDVSLLPPFDPVGDPTSLSQRWKTWKKRFETYLLALNITEDKQKRALLLYQAGQDTQEIFETRWDGRRLQNSLGEVGRVFCAQKERRL